MVKLNNDNTVTIQKWAAIFGLFVTVLQTLVIFYGAFVIIYTVKDNEKKIQETMAKAKILDTHETRLCNLEDFIVNNRHTIANIPVLSEKIDSMCKAMGRVEGKLDSLDTKIWEILNKGGKSASIGK